MTAFQQIGSTLEEAKSYYQDTLALRRWFHAHPEPGQHEYKTAGKIREELTKLHISYETVGETGIVGTIRGTATTRTNPPIVGLRADIDALEIQELNEVPYKSLHPGLMHACGHDGHTAALLTAARILEQHKANLPGTVKLIFEPAEEVGCGAEAMIQSGVVRDVNAFFGIHVVPNLAVGQVSVVNGPVMAGANSLSIEIEGQSGHGAKPHQSRDAVTASCAIVQALQQIVSREANPVDPAVLTIGRLQAGTRGNIIANQALLQGTLRVISEAARREFSEAVQRIVTHVAAAHRVDAKIQCDYATPILYNHETLYPTVLNAVKAILPENAVCELPIEMTADDFAFYSSVAPIFYAKVGVGGDEKDVASYPPLHSAKFTLDEQGLSVAAALYAEFVYQYFGVDRGGSI